jgi:hypothetical protein
MDAGQILAEHAADLTLLVMAVRIRQIRGGALLFHTDRAGLAPL